MTRRMARCVHDANAGPRLGLSIDLLERRPRKVRDVRQVGVVVLFPRVRELALLHEDWRPGEVAVAPRVVGVEMAIGDELDVGDALASRAKRLIDRPHVHGFVEIDHLSRFRREACVEQEHTTRVLDDERCNHDPLARKAIAVGRHRVMPGVDGLNARVSHVPLTLAASPTSSVSLRWRSSSSSRPPESNGHKHGTSSRGDAPHGAPPIAND